ncbi:MAG: TIGR02757 family protein [Bacteroidia bacterium]
MGAVPLSQLRAELEALYTQYHHPTYRAEDPVEVVWSYAGPENQELVGLWAALFAWGLRRITIQKVRTLLAPLGAEPVYALRQGATLACLRHRTWSPEDIQALWQVLRNFYRRHGTLANFFWRYRWDWAEGIKAFQEAILGEAPKLRRHIGYVAAGSPSKRLQLWLRWMVRRDAIDPGPWEGFSPQRLFLPVDTHLARWAAARGLCAARTPTWSTVVALTEVFRRLAPEDPLRYDFALVTAAARKAPTPTAL